MSAGKSNETRCKCINWTPEIGCNMVGGICRPVDFKDQTTINHPANTFFTVNGETKREKWAAQFMQGMLSNPQVVISMPLGEGSHALLSSIAVKLTQALETALDEQQNQAT